MLWNKRKISVRTAKNTKLIFSVWLIHVGWALPALPWLSIRLFISGVSATRFLDAFQWAHRIKSWSPQAVGSYPAIERQRIYVFLVCYFIHGIGFCIPAERTVIIVPVCVINNHQCVFAWLDIQLIQKLNFFAIGIYNWVIWPDECIQRRKWCTA